VYCLFAWALACLLFSKPINLFLNWTGGFLFSFDEHSLRIYQWALIGLLVVYLAGRVIWFGRFLWGRFPVLYLGTPLLIWYLINEFFPVKPEIYFESLPDLENLNFFWLVFGLYLVDLFALTFLCLVKIEPQKNHSSFITDLAINPEKNEPDLLGFGNFAERIANEIKTVFSSESVVFGINGEWGEGKTSMINLIRKKLENENYTVVDFHPWKTNSGIAVNQLFFDVLKDGLKKKIFGINHKIDRYAEALLQLDNTGIGKTLWQLIFQSEPVEKQKEKLGESMKMLDKNLVVVVDDLDRLAKNEIADVLKIMRDTANFPNLVFLAAYDRHYLNMAIKDQINEHNYENYMDKIVLWEAPIYKPQPRKYVGILKEYFEEGYSKYHETIGSLFLVKYEVPIMTSNSSIISPILFYEVLDQCFNNLREVKRFYNAFSFEFRHIESKGVDFHDFFCLSLMKFKSKEYYNLFIKAFFQLNGTSGRTERTGKILDEHQKYIELIKIGEGKKYLENILIYLIKYNSSQSDNSGSFGFYKNWLLYFFLGNYEEITMSEFSAMLMAEDFNGFKEKIDSILENKKLMKQFSHEEIIFSLRGNFNMNEQASYIEYFKQLLWLSFKIDKSEFFKKCHFEIKLICSFKENEIKIIQENLKVFFEQEQVYRQMQYFFYYIINENINAPKISRNNSYIDLNIAIKYSRENFKYHLKIIQEINPETIQLFYCSYRKVGNMVKAISNATMIELMRSKIKNHPDDFLKYVVVLDSLITPKIQLESPYDYRYVEFLVGIFENPTAFEMFMIKTKFTSENRRAKVYLKYFRKILATNSENELFYPFTPTKNDYTKFFSRLDDIDVLLDWKLRAQIDRDLYNNNTK